MTVPAIGLENWYILGDLAPGKCRLVGVRSSDGHEVRTTPVVSAEGRMVRTSSGTLYRLGRPHADFVLYQGRDGLTIDEERPFGI
jgi:hypothetical protein